MTGKTRLGEASAMSLESRYTSSTQLLINLKNLFSSGSPTFVGVTMIFIIITPVFV